MTIEVICHEYDDRRKDLEHAKSVVNDPFKSRWARNQAQKAIDEILKQLGDKKLQLLRQKLISAARAHDDLGQWKIAAQIKEYLRQPIPTKPINEM